MGAQQSSPLNPDNVGVPASSQHVHVQSSTPTTPHSPPQAQATQSSSSNAPTPQAQPPLCCGPHIPNDPPPTSTLGDSASKCDGHVSPLRRSSLDLQRVSRPMGYHCPFHTRLPSVPHPRRRSLHLPTPAYASSSPMHRETPPYPGPFSFVCGLEDMDTPEVASEQHANRCQLSSSAEEPLPTFTAPQSSMPDQSREPGGCDAITRPDLSSALSLASMATMVRNDANLEDLPPELLRRVLARVPRASWPAVRSVSRTWRDLVCSPDMLRLRRREGLGEPWAFLVQWMFRGSRDALAMLWAMDPCGTHAGTPGISQGAAGVPKWYCLGCLPPMAGISHTSQVVAYGPYAVFLGGNVAARSRGGTLTFVPGTAVWRHHLLTGHTRRLPDMLHSRVGCATVVLNGKLVVAGGTGEADAPLRTVEEFDPKLGKWAPLPDLRVARRRCFGAEIGGRLWVFSLGAVSESQSRSAEVYDPATQKWTFIEHMLPNSLGGRVSTRFAVVGGKLVLTNHVHACAHDVMVYDEEKNAWCTVGQLPVAGFQGYGVLGMGDTLYVEGGNEPIPISDAAQLATALCTQNNSNFLRKAPYVNVFRPFKQEDQQWQPRKVTMEGIPRRCQQAVVSVL